MARGIKPIRITVMKIVLAAGLYPPDIGGPATFAQQLVESLRACSVEVVVVPFREVRHLPLLIRHVVYFFKVLRVSGGSSYIIALDPVSVGLPAVMASRFRFVPCIVRVGGDYAWEQAVQRFGVTDSLDAFLMRSTQDFPFAVRLMIMLQSLVARSAARVVVPSEYLKTVVTNWGVVSSKITRIYSSAHVGVLPSREEARLKFGCKDMVIVSAGRFVPWKGFEALIDAIEVLTGTYPNIQLYIAGSGPDNEKIRAHSTKLGLRVRFMGDMKKDDLAALVRAADVFVLNTNYEGLSHQLIEVMQVGTPIVTTKVGGNLELLQDGVSGRLVTFNDTQALVKAIDDVLSNPAHTKELVKQAQLRAQVFSSIHSMSEWQALLGLLPSTSPHVLMLSGDPLVLKSYSGVFQRLQLQAAQVASLWVFVRGSTEDRSLGANGRVRGWGGSKLSVARHMLRAGIALEHVDVVTAQDPYFLGCIAWYIARVKKAALQLQIHTNIFSVDMHHGAIKAQLALFLLRRADSIRVVSLELQEALIKNGIRAPITILPIFIDSEAIQKAPPMDLRKDFPQFDHCIVVAARLEVEKHIEDIIEAMPHILKQVPKVGLLIAGTGTAEEMLKERARALGVEAQVQFLGYRSDVYSLYKGADVVFAATADYEGYGATAVEALAAGAAVVATRDAGIAKEAGSIVVSREQLAPEVVRIIHHQIRGVLHSRLPTAASWAMDWRAGLP